MGFSKVILCLFFSEISLTEMVNAADFLPAAPFAPVVIEGESFNHKVSSDIKVQGRSVRENIVLVNIGKSDRITNFAYHLPEFKWEGMSNDYFDKDFPELEVIDEHGAVKPSKSSVAYLNGINVSAELLARGIDPLMVANADSSKFPVIDSKNKTNAELNEMGIFDSDGEQYYPKWSVAVSLTWSVLLKKKSIYKFATHYQAKPGFSIFDYSDERFGSKLKEYCMDGNGFAGLLSEKKMLPKYFLVEEYDIPISLWKKSKSRIEFEADKNINDFTPLLVAQCEGNYKSFNRKSLTSFSASGINSERVRFMLLSYQRGY